MIKAIALFPVWLLKRYWWKLTFFLSRQRHVPAVSMDLVRFCRASGDDKRFPALELYPCLDGKNVSSIPFDRHYLLHPAWAARILAREAPPSHVDISSIASFASLISAFIPTTYYEYSPADLELPGLTLGQADLLNLPFETNSIASLSCMHVLEHVGLARYGDPIDPQGDLKACRELYRVLKPGGNLLVAVPIGETPRIEFNAHRIYDYHLVLDMFPAARLKEFSLIPGPPKPSKIQSFVGPEALVGERYACGCFHFTKTDA